MTLKKFKHFMAPQLVFCASKKQSKNNSKTLKNSQFFVPFDVISKHTNASFKKYLPVLPSLYL